MQKNAPHISETRLDIILLPGEFHNVVSVEFIDLCSLHFGNEFLAKEYIKRFRVSISIAYLFHILVILVEYIVERWSCNVEMVYTHVMLVGKNAERVNGGLRLIVGQSYELVTALRKLFPRRRSERRSIGLFLLEPFS